MNYRFLFFILSFLPVCSAYGYPPLPIYPVAESGAEFHKEAEAFVIARTVHASGLRNKDHFINDPRDWEPVLEKLIREPSVHGIRVSGVAFDYTVYRGTAGEPGIVAATGEWFNRHIQAALERHEKYSLEGNPKHAGVYATFPGVINRILRVGVPSHLTRVLDYLNSPADEKIRIIDSHTSKEVASALRSYGEAIHLEAAEKFATRLRAEGKSDIADDIDRSIERIRKNAARKTATAGNLSENGPKNAPAANDQNKDASPDTPFWPWLAAVAALVAALVAYFRMKKS